MLRDFLVIQLPQTGGDSTQSKKSADTLLSQAVASKLEDGNLRAAIWLLVSDDTPVMPSAEGLNKPNEKHPPATLDVSSLPQSDNFLSVSETDVRKAVMSFPAGSSGGPDGLWPQHLKDLLNNCEARVDLLMALTAFVNMALAGRYPSVLAPIFSAAISLH